MTASVFRLPISVVRVPVKCQHPVRVALFAAADEGHGDGLARVIAREVAVLQHLRVNLIHHVHPLLVREREAVAAGYDRLEFRHQRAALLQQPGVTRRDRRQLVHREVRV
ncbi:hypothetical protein Cop2CBH44_20220 [Coprobacter secundus subsp. similis]|uniref:Uncharacterized protein n=1 Tax=Coprobacter secundus subsp. similis TaxID=2751153 RepID=A0A7G1HVF1_9BACT|nr:hypothetical protein Cop2CBH44_20220 [Coprobacter secundus subsp. similis]